MFNQGVLGIGKSYISAGTGLLNNPRHILGFSNNSFLQSLSDTTLQRIKGRSDPSLACYWDITMPDIPTYEDQQTTLGMIADKAGKFGEMAKGFGLDSVAGVANKVGEYANDANEAVLGFLGGNPVANVSLDSEYVEGMSLVFPEYGTREINRGGVMRKYPDSNVTIGDLTLTFYVGDDNEAYKYILNWMQLVSTPASQKAPDNVRLWTPPVIYKKTISVVVLDVNGNDVYSIDYIGCWPKSFSDVQLDAEGERLTYDVSFSVDNMCTYGFRYVSLTDELSNMGSLLLGKVTTAAMGKATELVSGMTGGK